MKPKKRHILRRILTGLILIIAIPVVALNVTMNFFIPKTTAEDYSDWMLETLEGSRRVIDVAMLGAHDAMTSDISFFSKVDALSADSIQTGFTGALIKGFSVKQSKTQRSTTARGTRRIPISAVRSRKISPKSKRSSPTIPANSS